jgi:glutamine amidotransferase
MLLLALPFGLPEAVARMAGLVESTGYAHDVRYPLQMTVARGHRRRARRDLPLLSEGRSRSLYCMDTLRALHPDESSAPARGSRNTEMLVRERRP